MRRQPLVLIVDDEERVREGMRLLLEARDVELTGAASAEEALEILSRRAVDVVFLDLRLPGMNGLQALERIVRDHPHVTCIMISGHGTATDAVRAVQLGAYDYIEKPVQPERLYITLNRALHHRSLVQQLEVHRAEAHEEWQLVGSGPAMQRLRADIARAAPSNGWVLIEGENGTGKELVARLIHAASSRRERPFVRLNSAALPRDLVESELFGHEPGAFTGALKRRKGKLEQAHGGTLFLDEVADMDPAAQAKLLRALSTGEVERLGGSEVLRVEVRLICATNRDLRAEVAAGRFRQDLYFRICVIPIRVPPLRERGDEILELVDHFLGRYCAENGRAPLRLDAEARRALLAHDWPGNVRELRNLIERLAIMHPSPVVTAGQIEAYLGSPLGAGTRSEPVAPSPDGAPLRDAGLSPAPGAERTLKERLEDAERAILREVLARWGWNVTRAAEELAVDRATLHRRTRRLAIRRPRPPGRE